jgi:hypothetical protein
MYICFCDAEQLIRIPADEKSHRKLNLRVFYICAAKRILHTPWMNDRRQPTKADPRRRRGWFKPRLSTVIVRSKKPRENCAQRKHPDNEPTNERNAIGSPLAETIFR